MRWSQYTSNFNKRQQYWQQRMVKACKFFLWKDEHPQPFCPITKPLGELSTFLHQRGVDNPHPFAWAGAGSKIHRLEAGGTGGFAGDAGACTGAGG